MKKPNKSAIDQLIERLDRKIVQLKAAKERLKARGLTDRKLNALIAKLQRMRSRIAKRWI